MQLNLDQPPVQVEVAESLAALAAEEHLKAHLPVVLDPESTSETLHWGRNWLYAAELEVEGSEPIPVVSKLFRHQTLKSRLRRRMRGSKAARSYRAAAAVEAAGVRTPEPLLYADSFELEGPSWFVCRRLEEALEVRYVLRALNAGTAAFDFPSVSTPALLKAMGALAARLHEHQIWHRDLTSGNVLIWPPPPAEGPVVDDFSGRLFLLDLNRARLERPVSRNERMRELARMPVHNEADQEIFLAGYYGEREVPALDRFLYRCHHQGFLLKNRSKKSVRGFFRRLADMLLPRRKPHVHIPPSEEGTAVRDRIVWDRLSDQPHQHASKLDKLRVRARDAPGHLHMLGLAAGLLARSRSRARELTKAAFQVPIEFPLPGIALRPWPKAPEALLAEVEALGVQRVLLRLHAWEPEGRGDEEALAKALNERGIEVDFAVPQNRDLVRDPAAWRRELEDIAERFLPLGQHFQVGQAVNRSKWGVWRAREFVDLYSAAREVLRASAAASEREVRVLGPAVIDFEPHATAGYLGRRAEGFEFDVVSHLLYVDRRGAPENRQLGQGTVGKLAWMRALAEKSPNCSSGRSWVTEVNWPLQEGPHSPAGKDVAVSEERQADYLARYFLMALGSGLAERVYWWQLIARGYGLIAPDPKDPTNLRRRASFDALAWLAREMSGRVVLGRLRTTADIWLLRFAPRACEDDQREVLVGWSASDAPLDVSLPEDYRGEIASARDIFGRGVDRRGRSARLRATPMVFRVERSE